MENTNPYKKSSGYQTPNENFKKMKNSSLKLTTLHGSVYLQKLNIWRFAILVSFLLATIFISIIYYEEMKRDSSPRKLSSIPFPAVTICPETKARKSVIDVSDAYHKITTNNISSLNDDEIKDLEALSQVCDDHILMKPLREIPTNGKYFEEILRNISIPDFTLFCKFQDKLVDCSELFTETLTSQGICKTFNFNDDDKIWNLIDGYKTDEFNVKPVRAVAGPKFGLAIVLNVNSQDLDYMCKGSMQGFSYKFHLPNESPNFESDESYGRVPLSKSVMASIKPKMTINSGFGLSCDNQNKFKECLKKCEVSHLVSSCGCKRFDISPNEDEIRTCNQHDLKCVSLTTREFFTNLTHQSENFPCQCKPNCLDLKYESSSTLDDFNFGNVVKSFKEDLDSEFPKIIMSRLIIYFEDKFIIPTIIENFSIFNFISKIGGILAFFLGASCLTIFEIFYLFTRKCFMKSSY